MSLIGLVRHMTEMERMYGHRLADWGTGLLYCTDEDEDADFAAVTAAGAAEDLGTFRAHCARTREIMAARELDDTFGKTNADTLRWFYLSPGMTQLTVVAETCYAYRCPGRTNRLDGKGGERDGGEFGANLLRSGRHRRASL